MTTGKCEICLMVTIARTEWPQPYWSCVLIVVLNKIWGNLFCVYIVKYKQASQIVVCVCVVTLVSVLLTMDKFHTFFLFLHCSFSKSFTHCSNFFLVDQPWELGKKCHGDLILTLAVAKVRYNDITTAKIFVKNLLFLVVYQWYNDVL